VSARRSPSVRARQLAAELRRLREAATLTADEAAGRLDWSPSKMSRLETGQSAVSAGDLRRLLDLYQVSGSYRERLVELGRTADQRGWWDAYSDMLRHSYSALLGLEAVAESERHFAPIVVPGLLQANRYAEELIRSSLVIPSPGEVARLAQARATRQRVLSKEQPLELSTVLDESVLQRQIAGPEAMREQLLHLMEMARRPNIDIQVLPLSAGAHLAVAGVFTILRFQEAQSDVVFIENMTSDLFVEQDAEVYRYSLASTSCVNWP
jgi:transcriptional regulator with XRE-family HTH domain